MVITISEKLKLRKVFICQHFSFYEQLKFSAKLSCMKKFYDARASERYQFCILVTYYKFRNFVRVLVSGEMEKSLCHLLI